MDIQSDKIIIKGYGKELGIFQLIFLSMCLSIFPILSLQHNGIDIKTVVAAVVCVGTIIFLFYSYKKRSWHLEINKTSIIYITSSIFYKKRPKWTFEAKSPNKIVLKKDRIRMTKNDYTNGICISYIDHTGKMTTKKVATPLTNKNLEDIARWTKTNDLNLIIEKPNKI
jgi:hypothetical protein